MSWIIKEDCLFFERYIKTNFDPFIQKMLDYKFRLLYAKLNYYHFPTSWKLDSNGLTLFYPRELLSGLINESKDVKFYPDLLKEVVFQLKIGFYGYFQFGIIEGRIFPPPAYLLNFESNPSVHENDKLYLSNLIHNYSKIIIDLETKDELKTLSSYVDNLDWDKFLKFIVKFENKKDKNFLSLLTEGEFFNKVKQIYLYRQLTFEESQEYGFTQKNERILEVNINYKDPVFGSIQRATVQDLWNGLIEQNKISRMIAIYPLSKIPNPLIKLDANTQLVEWFKPHVDQQLIFIKLKKSKIPIKGYFYVYEFGDIDQIYRKRDFISFSVNHPFLKDFFGNYESIKLSENVIERNKLASEILKEHGLFAVQGPPGTGKTFLAVETIIQLIKSKPNATILVSSKEHQALNHLMNKSLEALVKNNLPHYILRSISTERLKSISRSNQVTLFSPQQKSAEIGSLSWNSDMETWEDLQKSKLHEFDLRNRSFSESVATIIFATTMDSIHKRFLGRRSFDLVIIEEAGKCYPSELLHVINLGQIILLIGDQKQLPPYQIKETIENIEKMQKIFQKCLNDSVIKNDLISRMGKSYEDLLNFYQLHGPVKQEQFAWLKPFEHLFNILPENKKYILQDQYRMDKDLSSIIGKVFYNFSFNNKKGIYTPLQGVLTENFDFELVWIDTPHITDLPDAGEDPEGNGERTNNYELRIIIKFLNLLQITNKIDLIILTPYNDQKDYLLESDVLKEIVSLISKTTFENTIKTVDEYQGQEADLTIISLVRNNTLGISSSWGFLTEPERLNVMFSRSKSRQVIVGCSKHIERNESDDKMSFLVNFLKEYKEKGFFINAEEFLK